MTAHHSLINIYILSELWFGLFISLQKRLLMDLDISMRSSACLYTVHFYGALFREGDVWICMEVSMDLIYPSDAHLEPMSWSWSWSWSWSVMPKLNFYKFYVFFQVMDTSLDKFYPRVYKNDRVINEDILGKVRLNSFPMPLHTVSTDHTCNILIWTGSFIQLQIAVAVVNALYYLHANLKVIHRYVQISTLYSCIRGIFIHSLVAHFCWTFLILLCYGSVFGLLSDSKKRKLLTHPWPTEISQLFSNILFYWKSSILTTCLSLRRIVICHW